MRGYIAVTGRHSGRRYMGEQYYGYGYYRPYERYGDGSGAWDDTGDLYGPWRVPGPCGYDLGEFVADGYTWSVYDLPRRYGGVQ